MSRFQALSGGNTGQPPSVGEPAVDGDPLPGPVPPVPMAGPPVPVAGPPAGLPPSARAGSRPRAGRDHAEHRLRVHERTTNA